MARPREFDSDNALAKAMDVFWEQGYGNATLPDLLAGMHLTRGSLYKAFKDKKSLFLRVLDTYDEQVVSDAVVLLTDEGQGGWDRIFALFESISDAVEAGDRRGCLLCSTLAGPAAYDRDIAAFAAKSLERMRAGFQVALTNATSADESKPLAQLFVTQYVGLQIMSRTSVPALMIKQNTDALRNFAKRISDSSAV